MIPDHKIKKDNILWFSFKQIIPDFRISAGMENRKNNYGLIFN